MAVQSGSFVKPATGADWIPSGSNWRDSGAGGTPGSLQLNLGTDGQKDQRARTAASFIAVDGIPITVSITMKAAPAKGVVSTFALSTGADKCDIVRFSIVPQGPLFMLWEYMSPCSYRYTVAASLTDDTVQAADKTTTLDGIGIDVASTDACSADPQDAFSYAKDFGSFDAANTGFVLHSFDRRC